MAQVKYLKESPLAFTLPDGQEYILSAGKSYDLPAENEYIRGLIEQGYLALVPVPVQKPAKSIAHKKTDK